MISFIEVFLLAAIFGVLYAMLQLASRWPDSNDAVERPAGDGGWGERVMLASHVRTCDPCSPWLLFLEWCIKPCTLTVN